MSELSRRDVLRNIGISLSLARMGQDVLSAQDAGHVHHMVAQERAKGVYKPKELTAHEYATLERLAALIIPADEHSKGAVEAGAPEFIDLLCAASDDMAGTYHGGLAWLDHAMRQRHGTAFVDEKVEQQTAMLDLIAYRRNETPQTAPGIEFFTWLRNMVADAFYSSKLGWDDLGYMGNGAMAKFEVPAEAIEYALKRSPLP